MYYRLVDIWNVKVPRARFSGNDFTVLMDRLGPTKFFPFIQPEQAFLELDFSVHDQKLAAGNVRRWKIPALESEDVDWWSVLSDVNLDMIRFIEVLDERYLGDLSQAYADIDGDGTGKGGISLNEFEDYGERLEDARFRKNCRERNLVENFERRNRNVLVVKLSGFRAIFRNLDATQTGNISREEWTFLDSVKRELDRQMQELCSFILWNFGGLEKAFRKWDVDHDGVLSQEEWTQGLQEAGFFGAGDELFSILDVANGGTITREEFSRISVGSGHKRRSMRLSFPNMLRHGRASRLRSLPLALVGAFSACFVLGPSGSGKVSPPTKLSAVGVETQELSTEVDLLPGERYIASNRFMVREGSDAAFEQRWAQRKSSLLTLPGFRWFSLMRRVPTDDPTPYPDDYSYISFTIWETKKDFNFWRKGPASFLTSKGPPKPFFWEGVLPITSNESRERLLSGPGSRPEADGEKVLEPEVFVATTRFQVFHEREQDFEKFWSEHGASLEGQGGFRFSQLLRRDQAPDDDCNYMGVTVWDDRESFEACLIEKAKVEASPPGDALMRPALKMWYEGKLVLESESGP
eukprot:g13450.t2